MSQGTFQFRRARLEDARAISDLIRILGQGFPVNSDGSGAELFWDSVSENSEAGRIADPNRCIVVAECGNKLAGFAGLRDATHLFHLFVAEEFQRQGLATKLWELMRAEAIKAGNKAAITVNSSLNAVPVYQRFGFQPTDGVTQKDGIAFLPMKWVPSGIEI